METTKKRTAFDIMADIEALYEDAVQQEIKRAEETGEEWDGTLPDSLDAALSALDGELDSKKEGVIRGIKQIVSDAAMLKQEKKNIDKRIKAKERKVERFYNYLDMLQGGTRFECVAGVISYKKSETTEIDPQLVEKINAGDIPEDILPYVIKEEKTEYKIPKKELKKALEGDVKIEGVHIEKHIKINVK